MEILVVAADDLDVDRRGQSKVQDLVHHVAGLEIERAVRELFRENLAQPAYVLLGWDLVLGFQRYQDFTVSGKKRDVVAVREVGGRRDADVVDDHVQILRIDRASDLDLHFRKNRARIVNARADRCIDVQSNLSSIHNREKLPADKQHRSRGTNQQHDEQSEDGGPAGK